MKKLILIILLLSLPGCAKNYLPPVEQVPIQQMFSASSPEPPKDIKSSWTTANKLWFTAAIGGQAADAATTISALDGGNCREGNPLMGDNPSDAVVIGSKLALLGAGFWYTEYYLQDDPRQQQAIIAEKFPTGFLPTRQQTLTMTACPIVGKSLLLVI